MTTILLDDVSIDDLGAASTVGEAVSALRDRVHRCDRMIVAIQCDGRPMVGEDLSRTLERPLSDYQRIELHSEAPRGLALGALRQARARLVEARGLRPAIADALAQARLAEAMSGLAELVRICAQAHETVLKTSAVLGLDLGRVEVQDRDVARHIERVADSLRQLRESLLAQDFVVVADQMQFEMCDTLDAWDEILAAVLARAEAHA